MARPQPLPDDVHIEQLNNDSLYGRPLWAITASGTEAAQGRVDWDLYSTATTKTINAALKNIAPDQVLYISSKDLQWPCNKNEVTKNARGHIQAFACSATAASPS